MSEPVTLYQTCAGHWVDGNATMRLPLPPQYLALPREEFDALLASVEKAERDALLASVAEAERARDEARGLLRRLEGQIRPGGTMGGLTQSFCRELADSIDAHLRGEGG